MARYRITEKKDGSLDITLGREKIGWVKQTARGWEAKAIRSGVGTTEAISADRDTAARDVLEAMNEIARARAAR